MNLLFGFIVSFLVGSSDGPAREVFVSQGCVGCHSVTVAGISRRGAADGSEGPDLSHTGAKYDKRAIAGYLLKKVEHDGEKHKKSFGGTIDELKLVSEWLSTLK